MTMHNISNPEDMPFYGSATDYELELVRFWNEKIAAKISGVLLPS